MRKQGAVYPRRSGARRSDRGASFFATFSLAGILSLLAAAWAFSPVQDKASTHKPDGVRAGPPMDDNGNSRVPLGRRPVVHEDGATVRRGPDESGPAKDPLARLRGAVPLPAAASDASTGRQTLGLVPASALKDLAIAINSDAVALAHVTFRVGSPAVKSGSIRWPIRVDPSGDTAMLKTADRARLGRIGQIVASNGTLHFEFDATARNMYRAHLCNCLLIFSVGATERVVQLRKPIETKPVELSLHHVMRDIEFEPGGPMPSKRCFAVEVAVDATTRKKLVEIPQQALLTLTESVAVKIARWPGAEIRFRMQLHDDTIRLKVMPRFCLNSHRYPLTIDSITKQLALRLHQQARNHRDLELAKKRLAKIPGDFRKASRVKTRTPAQRGIRSMNMAVLDREAAKLQARGRRLAATIPRLERSIQQLRELLSIARQLDKHVRISVRVVARTSCRDIELVVTR